MAWSRTGGGRRIEQLHFALTINGEARNAVVAAIGAIEDFRVGGMEGDFGSGVILHGCLKSGNTFYRFQRALGFIPSKRCHSVIQLVDDVEFLPVWTERAMARPSSGRCNSSRRIVFGQQMFFSVKLINVDVVGSQISDERKFLLRAEVDAMRVWSFLTACIWTSADVLVKGTGWSEAAVSFDRQTSNTAAGVVGDQQVFPSLVHKDVAGPVALGFFGVEERQFPCAAINFVSRDGAGLAFVDGVKEFAFLIDREKRWVGSCGDKSQILNFARGFVELEKGDSFLWSLGVGTDVNVANGSGREIGQGSSSHQRQ